MSGGGFAGGGFDMPCCSCCAAAGPPIVSARAITVTVIAEIKLRRMRGIRGVISMQALGEAAYLMILFALALSKPDNFPDRDSRSLTLLTNSPKQSFRRDGR